MRNIKRLCDEAQQEVLDKNKHTPAFNLIYISYAPELMVNVFARWFDTPQKMLDASNTFWAVVRPLLHSFNPEKALFYTWLHKIARNYCHNSMKEYLDEATYQELCVEFRLGEEEAVENLI